MSIIFEQYDFEQYDWFFHKLNEPVDNYIFSLEWLEEFTKCSILQEQSIIQAIKNQQKNKKKNKKKRFKKKLNKQKKEDKEILSGETIRKIEKKFIFPNMEKDRFYKNMFKTWMMQMKSLISKCNSNHICPAYVFYCNPTGEELVFHVRHSRSKCKKNDVHIEYPKCIDINLLFVYHSVGFIEKIPSDEVLFIEDDVKFMGFNRFRISNYYIDLDNI